MSASSTSSESLISMPGDHQTERSNRGEAAMPNSRSSSCAPEQNVVDDVSSMKSDNFVCDNAHGDGDLTDNMEINKSDMLSSKYIVDELKVLYRDHVLEAEKRYHLHHNFCLPTDGEIKESEFDATPMVLLIGQYSTGKTTFLSHLLGDDFPGMHIGPEPTTDKFMALFYGGEKNEDSAEEYRTQFHKKQHSNRRLHDGDDSRSMVTDDIASRGRLIKGNTLTVTPSLPFSSLSQFGSAFLNHFVGSSSSSPLLKRITFIDTPGVLSGEKQRINRTYNFGQVSKWFADRSDLILLLFDAHKLDISDELKDVIDTIRPYNDDKIRCILNKADGVTKEQLVRVYGSLMWSMGKIFDSPEVVRVYTGSYWNGPLANDDFEQMFEKDEQLLVRELVDLPRCAAERKVNQMVNRIRLVKVHVCILGMLRELTPRFFGKRESRDQLLEDLDAVLDRVRVEYDLSKGDMPNSKDFAKCLKNFPDFSVFPEIDPGLIECFDRLIEKDIPMIVREADVVSIEAKRSNMKGIGTTSPAEVIGGAELKFRADESSGHYIFRFVAAAFYFCMATFFIVISFVLATKKTHHGPFVSKSFYILLDISDWLSQAIARIVSEYLGIKEAILE